jgi:hypothetical protein
VRRDHESESSCACSKVYNLLGFRDQYEIEELLALCEMSTPCETCFEQALYLCAGNAFCCELCMVVFYDSLSMSDLPDYDDWEGF